MKNKLESINLNGKYFKLNHYQHSEYFYFGKDVEIKKTKDWWLLNGLVLDDDEEQACVRYDYVQLSMSDLGELIEINKEEFEKLLFDLTTSFDNYLFSETVEE